MLVSVLPISAYVFLQGTPPCSPHFPYLLELDFQYYKTGSIFLQLIALFWYQATVNYLLGDTFSRENNMHRSRFHDWDPQLASEIWGAMTQSCYIGSRDIRSRIIRVPTRGSLLYIPQTIGDNFIPNLMFCVEFQLIANLTPLWNLDCHSADSKLH